MRSTLLMVGAAALGLTALHWAFRPAAERLQPARAVAAEPPPFTFAGVASCAAAACHGNGSIGSRGGEWNTWARLDPHAQAYDTLLTDRSRAIARRLYPEQADPRPEADALCLNCHVQPGITTARRSPRFALADGVGCESCHGASVTWLDEHTHPGWQPLAGMTDLRDLRVRAEACTTCHIGAGDVQVNHDLVAAGHPRLRFEFATYLANLPPHWSVEKDRKRHPDLEARAWLVGQGVSGRAALRLLAHRAADAGGVWPELAEYDCYACHHDLAAPSWRQGTMPPDGKPGQLMLNGWYYDALIAVTKDIDLASLRQAMASGNLRRRQIAELAGTLTRRLEAAQPELATRPLTRADRLGLLADLAALDRRPGLPSWDRATQAYLGAEALTSGADLPAGVRTPLAQLRTLLHEAFQTGKDHVLASPQGYDPQAVRRCWQELREASGGR